MDIARIHFGQHRPRKLPVERPQVVKRFFIRRADHGAGVENGNDLIHLDLPQLVHIGGLAHYLSPPAYRTNERGEQEPDWTVWDSMVTRHEVTRFTALTLRAMVDGEEPPALPAGIEPEARARLELVRSEVVDLLELYGDHVGTR